MSAPTWTDAGAAALVRALECRVRAERLRAGAKSTASDAQAAGERLAVARIRAQTASARLQRWKQGLARSNEPDTRSDAAALADIRRRMTAIECSVNDLWVAYMGLCGQCSAFDVDAALHGLSTLPELEVARLDHALWEMETCS